ncbi:hypothetical protein EDD37DRAFT_624505 [Exophiala viscosa]|uniref:Uncharacterized protein n=1 Tax=Exophiala viscosa TaxID=2486360 RepID=A0AAN6IKZ6_9EURO|nr:hypothetical protein EDD36DRAFT_460692 [Exophiala viscosa]KAI1628189.1 hypothetical protein EDD37DRAFT_624505 [Exophiala viscosa]
MDSQKPPIPSARKNAPYPPAGVPAPGPGQLFHGVGGGAAENAPPRGTTPPPSAVYGNLPGRGHSGGPSQPGYPFFGATHTEGDRSGLSTQPAPGLATGPAGNHPVVSGPVTDFYGSADRHAMGPMQPPVFNHFATLQSASGAAGRAAVNSALNQTAGNGTLHMGSSGIGASHGGVPLTTNDGFHMSADPQQHATIDPHSSFSADGRTHLYADGSSSTVAPQQPGQMGNRPVNHVPGQVGSAIEGQAAAGSYYHPIDPTAQPVQDTHESGTGSYYPDPAQAAKAAGT